MALKASASTLFKIEIQLIYSVVLVSAVQQSDSVIQYICFLKIIFIMVYHETLNIVPCAIQQGLVYPVCLSWFASANPKLRIHPTPPTLCLGNHKSVLQLNQYSYRGKEQQPRWGLNTSEGGFKVIFIEDSTVRKAKKKKNHKLS